MVTKIIRINPRRPGKDAIAMAAAIIRKGGLVVFPTETVYGLGANAFDSRAARKIFKAKGRPPDDPLIVHIASPKDLSEVAECLPGKAKMLAERFWPGPLTLVLKKKAVVPPEVTSGLDTVAVRMPGHKVALALIRAAGVPIAAPSANLFGRPSPTVAGHAISDLKGKADMILDGGPSEIGVESTVLDLTSDPPVVLRPGGITLEELKKVLPGTRIFSRGRTMGQKIQKSPGMKYRHYAPKAKVILVGGKAGAMTARIRRLIAKYNKQGKKTGVMSAKETKNAYGQADLVLPVGSRKDLPAIARNLFETLREFDRQGIDIILAESFAKRGMGLAVMNRLERAAEK